MIIRIKNGLFVINKFLRFANGLKYIYHKHFVRKFHDRNFAIIGKRQPTIRQLSPISWTQLNDGDAFVLDSGLDLIFVWNGQQANRLEKLQASKVR